MSTITLNISSALADINFGLLYNYYAVKNINNITNTGYHIPTDTEWKDLRTFLGGSLEGGKLKEIGLTYWNTPNAGATDEVGFNGRGAGERTFSTGLPNSFKEVGIFWSSTDSGVPTFGLGAFIRYNDTAFGAGNSYDPRNGFSVRAVKDFTLLAEGEKGIYIGNNGVVYETIVINGVEWVLSNLIETEYRDNSPIALVTDNTNWTNLVTGAYGYPDNNINNV